MFWTKTLWILTLLGLSNCNPKPQRSQLTIYAAASLATVVEQLGSEFSAQHAIRVQYNFASSSTLARQLLAKPDADIYLSANNQWMDAVEQAGLLTTDSRAVLLTNYLRVVARHDSPISPESGIPLGDWPFSYCVVGDPAHVPIGLYAKQWLTSTGQWSAVQKRLSHTPDARATLAQVTARNDLIGIVYQSDYQSAAIHLRSLYQVPPSETPAIEYPIAILKNGQTELSQQFINFLNTESAQHTFQMAGFSIPE